MGSRSPEELAGKLRAAAENLSHLSETSKVAAGQAVVRRFNEIAAGAGLQPGVKIAGGRWPGAKAQVVSEGVKVGLTNPAQLVIGDHRTRGHLIGARALGTRNSRGKKGFRRGSIQRKVDMGMPLIPVVNRKGVARKGAKALNFPGLGDKKRPLYVHHPGSRRKNLWPLMQQEAASAATPAVRRAAVDAITRAGLGK